MQNSETLDGYEPYDPEEPAERDADHSTTEERGEDVVTERNPGYNCPLEHMAPTPQQPSSQGYEPHDPPESVECDADHPTMEDEAGSLLEDDIAIE